MHTLMNVQPCINDMLCLIKSEGFGVLDKETVYTFYLSFTPKEYMNGCEFTEELFLGFMLSELKVRVISGYERKDYTSIDMYFMIDAPYLISFILSHKCNSMHRKLGSILRAIGKKRVDWMLGNESVRGALAVYIKLNHAVPESITPILKSSKGEEFMHCYFTRFDKTIVEIDHSYQRTLVANIDFFQKWAHRVLIYITPKKGMLLEIFRFIIKNNISDKWYRCARISTIGECIIYYQKAFDQSYTVFYEDNGKVGTFRMEKEVFKNLEN